MRKAGGDPGGPSSPSSSRRSSGSAPGTRRMVAADPLGADLVDDDGHPHARRVQRADELVGPRRA